MVLEPYHTSLSYTPIFCFLLSDWAVIDQLICEGTMAYKFLKHLKEREEKSPTCILLVSLMSLQDKGKQIGFSLKINMCVSAHCLLASKP